MPGPEALGIGDAVSSSITTSSISSSLSPDWEMFALAMVLSYGKAVVSFSDDADEGRVV